MNTSEKKLVYLSLFSGIGGFEVGFTNAIENAASHYHDSARVQQRRHKQNMPVDRKQQMGKQQFSCCGFSEIDKHATAIYKFHYPNHKNYGDITKIDPATLPDFDLLTGGFPCQSFSVAGKRKGFSDTRGTLFFDVARILRHKKPKYFLLENVKGLLSHDSGSTFSTIIKILQEIGYGVSWKVLNTKDFGIPQNRERVFIFGVRGECPREILPLGENDKKCLQMDERKTKVTGTINTCMAKGGNKQDANSRVLVDEHSKIRRLTPRECEALQAFPRDWTKFGNYDGEIKEVSDTQRYKVCGNAITVKVAEAVIRQMCQ